MREEHPPSPDPSEHARTETALQVLNTQLLEKTQLLQTTLSSISQGILMVDANDRVIMFNPRVCELLELKDSLLASQPTMKELAHYQFERGDFGPGARLIDDNVKEHIVDVAGGVADTRPCQYLRVTPKGRTLEVRSQPLPLGGMVRTYADVTEHIQAQAARRRVDELLAATQTITQVGGWEHDYVGDVIFWTEGVYRILELSLHEFIPSDLASTHAFFTPHAREMLKPVAPGPYANTTKHDMELELMTATGRRIWVRFMGSTTWDQGQPVKQVCAIQDISDQKLTAAALHDSEERWKLALESTGDGMWDWYIQTGEEFFSKRLVEIYGYTENEIQDLADELDRRTHPDDAPQMVRDRQAHFDGLTPSYMNEHRVRCKDDSWKWVLSRGMLISRDAQGKPLRMIGTHTDVTVRKQLESDLKLLNTTLEERIALRTHELEHSNTNLKETLKNLETARDELVRREKLAALGAMVAGVSHELNTPIGNSLTVASTLEHQVADFSATLSKGVTRSGLDSFVTDVRDGVDILMRSLRRAVELIAGFKQVAVDQTSENRREFLLHETISDILLTLGPSIRKTRHTVTSDIPKTLRLQSYPGPLGQVIANLINNALIHGLEDRPNGHVTLHAHSPQDGWLRVTVQDDGAGIAPQHLARVFDPFFTTRLGQGGSGLGLNIVYNIVTEMLGGSIRVESEQGQGACFVIDLPCTAPITS